MYNVPFLKLLLKIRIKLNYIIIVHCTLYIVHSLKMGVAKTADNFVLEKSKEFAIRIIRMYKHLGKEKQEFVLSNQII